MKQARPKNFAGFAAFWLILPGLASLAGFVQAEDLDPFAHLSGAGRDAKNRLTFSQTQTWAERYARQIHVRPRFLAGWERAVAIPAPPANDSPRTRAELEYLRKIQGSRTEAQVAEIVGEIELPGFRLGPHTWPNLADAARRPRTKRLLEAANHDLAIVVFTLKKRFDRVRPSFLDSRIKPGIAIPPHPAYASGHSTQAHALAYLLQELDPANAEAIRRDAARIGKNRELAGVHYPSDTAAGRQVARQLVDLFLTNREFAALLREARAEWP